MILTNTTNCRRRKTGWTSNVKRWIS